MNMATRVDGVECRHCGNENVFMDVKEEPSVYKIGARCHSCDRDFGVIDRISRSDIEHSDEVYESGEERVREVVG